jgi:hypothetical protein
VIQLPLPIEPAPGPYQIEEAISQASRSYCNILREQVELMFACNWLSWQERQRLRMLIAARRWQREALAV